MVIFWRLVFILSDETTWLRKVTSLLRKWHLVDVSFKPAVLLRLNTNHRQWMCSSKIWAQMMISSKYTVQCVQVRPLGTRLINRVKLAGPLILSIRKALLLLFYLYNSFSGHRPALRECAWTSLPNPTSHKGWPQTHRGLRPLLFFDSVVGCFMSLKNKSGKVLWDGTYGFSSLSEKTKKYNDFQMSLHRQHWLGPAGGLNLRFPAW